MSAPLIHLLGEGAGALWFLVAALASARLWAIIVSATSGAAE